MTEIDLKPCPGCEGTVLDHECSYVRCDNPGCGMDGPLDDHTGEEWNALPRLEDVENMRKRALIHVDERDGWYDRARRAEHDRDQLKEEVAKLESWFGQNKCGCSVKEAKLSDEAMLMQAATGVVKAIGTGWAINGVSPEDIGRRSALVALASLETIRARKKDTP